MEIPTLQQMISGTIGLIKTKIRSCHAPEKVIEQRLDICRKCKDLKVSENSLTKKITYKCSICTCPIDKKVIVKDSFCPKKYWGKYEYTTNNK